MSDEKHRSLFSLGARVPLWHKGKTAASIAFVNEAEVYLQGRKVTGPTRAALISTVTMIKQGKWIITYDTTVDDVLRRFNDLISAEIILQDPSRINDPRPPQHPMAWANGRSKFTRMFVVAAQRILSSRTLQLHMARSLSYHVARIKRGEIEYQELYTVEQYLTDIQHNLI